MKYQIIRYYGNSKGYGKKFDSHEDANTFLQNDEKVQMDKEDGFVFSIERLEE